MEIFKIDTLKLYDWAFDLMLKVTSSYIYKVLDMMHISLDEFKEMMKTIGKVHGLKHGNELIGFYWIEIREEKLHIHAICIDSSYQGQGYGKYLMNDIFTTEIDSVNCIELGVEINNEVAINLYKKLGFRIVSQLDELGFYIMEKEC